MSYWVYGRRTEPWYNSDTKEWNEPDKNFRALNGAGIRVNKLSEACEFATKEDAQQFIDSHSYRDGVKLEIRKKK